MTDNTIEKQNNIEVLNQPKRSNWSRIGILISTLAILIIVSAFAYAFFQLTKINMTLAQDLADVETKTANNQKDLATVQTSLSTLQQEAQKTAELSAKQEQMIAEWQAAQTGNLAKWYAAEAQYLVKLANDHLQFTHDKTLALTLLQRAQQVLQELPTNDLLDIRKSLANDIAKLQATVTVDTTALYLQLNGLNNLIDQLPLPSSPLKADETQHQIPNATAQLPWWKAGLQHTWNALSKIVIVRSDNNIQPLVLPDEKIFLYQNLHAQLENAMWAVIHRNQAVYQASLARALDWTQKYFDQSAQPTITMILNLRDLSKINIEPSSINVSETLQLFDKYVSESKQSKTAPTV